MDPLLLMEGFLCVIRTLASAFVVRVLLETSVMDAWLVNMITETKE